LKEKEAYETGISGSLAKVEERFNVAHHWHLHCCPAEQYTNFVAATASQSSSDTGGIIREARTSNSTICIKW